MVNFVMTRIIFLFLIYLVYSQTIHLRTKKIDTDIEKSFNELDYQELLQKYQKYTFLQKTIPKQQLILTFKDQISKDFIQENLKISSISYLPENSFLLFTNAQELLKITKEMNNLKWIGHFKPSYKTLLNYSKLPKNVNFNHKVNFYLITLKDCSNEFIIWKNYLKEIYQDDIILQMINSEKFYLQISLKNINQVLEFFKDQEEIHWIEKELEFTTNNFAAHSITQDGIPYSGKTPLWDKGLTGNDQIIGIGDTGIDHDMCFYNDPSIPIPINKIDFRHRKIIGYFTVKVVQADGSIKETNTKDYPSGHGTHTTGSIAGKVFYNDSQRVQQLQDYNGMCPNSKIIFTDLMGDDNGLTIPKSLYSEYFPIPYNGGARIHSNSWGCAFPITCNYDCNCIFTINYPELGIRVGDPVDENMCQQVFGRSCCKYCNQYSSQTSEVDKFVHEKDDMVIVFAAGNTGHFSNSGTVSAPATCKNCLSVGASQTSNKNFMDAINHIDLQEVLNILKLPSVEACCSFTHSDSTYQKRVREACCPQAQKDKFKDTNLFNENNMAFFSSRGRTWDNRFKPEIVSPGFQVQSTHSDGNITSFQCGVSQPALGNDASILSMKGTSMATPIVAGSAGLVREYLFKGYYPTGTPNNNNSMISPSSALVRGMIIHSASPLNGNLDYDYHGNLLDLSKEKYPNHYTGYGLVTLKNVLKFNDSTFNLYLNDRIWISNLETQKFCFQMNDKTSFRVTLIWTDSPSSLASDKSLINNLNLIVYNERSRLFGNGEYDDVNTVEQVTISSLEKDQIIPVEVKGYIPDGKIKYSLIVTGNFKQISDCTPQVFNPSNYSILINFIGLIAFSTILLSILIGIIVYIYIQRRKEEDLPKLDLTQDTTPQDDIIYYENN